MLSRLCSRFGPFALGGVAVLWLFSTFTRSPEDPFARVVRKMRPAVVLVTVETPVASVRGAKKHLNQGLEVVYGSASIIKSNRSRSLLLTDAHVVDKAKDITVRLNDGRTLPARTIAIDHPHDAALLAVDVGALPVVSLGHTNDLEAGSPIGVAGYPIPDAFEDQHLNIALSAYSGRIASVRNSALELDMPIIPGESGGPVFDARDGAVIGIAESRFEEEPAIGFATPIEQLRGFIDHVPF